MHLAAPARHGAGAFAYLAGFIKSSLVVAINYVDLSIFRRALNHALVHCNRPLVDTAGSIAYGLCKVAPVCASQPNNEALPPNNNHTYTHTHAHARAAQTRRTRRSRRNNIRIQPCARPRWNSYQDVDVLKIVLPVRADGLLACGTNTCLQPQTRSAKKGGAPPQVRPGTEVQARAPRE